MATYTPNTPGSQYDQGSWSSENPYQGIDFGQISLGGVIGSIGGGLIGGIAGLFKKKKTAAQLREEMNRANDPHYYDKNAVKYGDYIGALNNWGLPGAQQYYQSNPQAADQLIRTYGAGAVRDRTGAMGDPAQWRNYVQPGMDYNTAGRQLVADTMSHLGGNQPAAQPGMFSMGAPRGGALQMAPQAGQGFGQGAGNMGSFTGGFGGQLEPNMMQQQAMRFRPQTLLPGA